MHWRYWTLNSYTRAVCKILNPVFLSAQNHKFNDHAVMITQAIFNPEIGSPSDFAFVEDSFNQGVDPTQCALSLVNGRMHAYDVAELDITVESRLFGEPGKLVRAN